MNTTYAVWYRFGPVGIDVLAADHLALGTAVLKVQSLKAKGLVAWKEESVAWQDESAA